jgi:acyl phosphate:glycerol-3-phosphate acyltransferase
MPARRGCGSGSQIHLARDARVCLLGRVSLLPAALLLVLFAYVCGSLPFGYWACRLKGVDIRKHGSGNIGATNVIRVMGKKTGIPVFALDMIKGLVPVAFAEWWMARCGADPNTATLIAVFCAAAAVLGHMFTFWLGFKGGKGVATSAGALIGLAWQALLIGFVVWLMVYLLTRTVALASIAAAVALPIAMAIVMTIAGRWNHVLLGLGIVMGTLVIVRHRSNIARLLKGTENRFGTKKGAP